MIYVDYVNGLHGRFICYCINALDPDVRNQDVNVFTDLGTIKNIFFRPLAESDHYSAHRVKIPGDNIVSVTAKLEDELLVNLLFWHRVNEYGFDLKNFHINFYDKVKNTFMEDLASHFDQYDINARETNTVPKLYLRELFKNGSQRPILRSFKQKHDSAYELYFRFLYNWESFIKELYKIKEHFRIAFPVDEKWYQTLWTKYMSYVYPILDEVKETEHILDCIDRRVSVNIDLNIIQEAWIDNTIEQKYVKLPWVDEYYTNTEEIIRKIDEIQVRH
jgi:hypothetical protein